VALRYCASGFHAFILRYSTGREAGGFAPLKEVSWVIGYLREHAQEWNIDPEKIVTCGFSAGGHLALSAGLLAENKPNAMILGYPATSAPNYPGADFMLKLLEGKDAVTDADAEKYDLPRHITAEAPPMFIAATGDDPLTAMCTLPVVMGYTKLGLKYELHIFQYGPHGYSLADGTCADGSIQVIDDAFAQWHGLSVKWMEKTLGKPEYVNKSTSKMAGYLKELGFITDEPKGAEFA